MLSRLCSLLFGQLYASRRGAVTYSASLTCCASRDLNGADLSCSILRCGPLREVSSVHSPTIRATSGPKTSSISSENC